MKKLVNTPPPLDPDIQYMPNVSAFLFELRTVVLKITIDELIFNLNWKNEKYYQQIVNGYNCNGTRKYKQPTINHLFTGLNFAVENFPIWKDKTEDIKALINKYLIKF